MRRRHSLPLREICAAAAKGEYFVLAGRARRIFSGDAIPLRLPFGAWWLAQRGLITVDARKLEDGRRDFVRKKVFAAGDCSGRGRITVFTRAGSKGVGRAEGIAFEPSCPKRGLLSHLRVNACWTWFWKGGTGR